MSEVDLAAPERWLESQRRSRSRRFAAARVAARRRFKHRSSVALIAVFALGAGGAAAHSTTSASSSPSRSSSSVAAVQEALGIPADGVAGPQTRRAIRRHQRRNGLTVDGIVGPQTLGSLGIISDSTATSSAGGSALAIIARCESGGDPTAISADGRYRGKYQFSRPTWRSMGGRGDPAAASEALQDKLAAKLYAQQGTAPWPVCGQQVG